MKKIDVIIPAYNCKDTLGKALSSIAMQSMTDKILVTIVNDGSRDGSYKKIIKAFAPYVEIRELILKENRGCGYARQYGIDNTECPYITFLDADNTFVNSRTLETMVNYMEDEDAVMCYSPIFAERLGGVLIPVSSKSTYLHGKVYSRDFLEKHNIKFSDQRICEDTYFQHLVNFYINQYKMKTVEFTEKTVVYSYNPHGVCRSIPDSEFSVTMLPIYLDTFVGIINTLKEDPNISTWVFQNLCLVEAYFDYNYLATLGKEDEILPSIKKLIDTMEQVDYRTCENMYRMALTSIDEKLIQDDEVSPIVLPTISFKDFIEKIQGE